MTTKDISILIERTDRATKLLLKELEKLDLITYTKMKDYKRKVYVVNPNFSKKGKMIEMETLQLFSRSEKLEKKLNLIHDLQNFETK